MICVIVLLPGNSLKSWWTGITSNPTSKLASSSPTIDDSLHQEIISPVDKSANPDIETPSDMKHQYERMQEDPIQIDEEEVSKIWSPLYNSDLVD